MQQKERLLCHIGEGSSSVVTRGVLRVTPRQNWTATFRQQQSTVTMKTTASSVVSTRAVRTVSTVLPSSSSMALSKSLFFTLPL